MSKIIECTIEDIYNFYKECPECIGMIDVETRHGFYAIEACDITAKNSPVYEISTPYETIQTSPDHLLFNTAWVKTKDINEGDFVLTKNGLTHIINKILLPYTEDLYDLQVATVREYYANNFVSHNSVILDAVSFGLFGQPYRKIRIAELINRRNKKHLTVEISFRIASDLYKITRGLNPAKLEVTKNDEPLDLLS